MTTSFDVGHLVWAKIQGVPWWPGQLMDPMDAPKDVQLKQRAGWRLVSFFGDNKWAFSQDQRMVDFEPHIEQYEQQKGCSKMKTWRLGVEEAKEVAARRAGRTPLTDHKPLDFITKKAAKLAAALAGVACAPSPSSQAPSCELTRGKPQAIRSPGSLNGSVGSYSLALGGGSHILGGGPKLAGATPKRHLKVPGDSAAAAAAATFTFAGNGASYANAASYYNNGNGNHMSAGGMPAQQLVQTFTTTGPGGGSSATAVQLPPPADATVSVGLSSHAASAHAAPGYIKTMLLAGGSFAEKVGGHPPNGVLTNGNGHQAPTPRRGGTSRAIELARNHVAATAAAASSNGGVNSGGVRKHTKVSSPGPRLSVAFAALASKGTPANSSQAGTTTTPTNRITPIAPSTATAGSDRAPTPSPSLPATSPPAAGVTSHGRAAAAGVAAAIALVAPSQNRSNQHSHTAGYQNCQNQTVVPWTQYLQLTSALPSDVQAVGAKASLAWLKDIARGGGGGTMPQSMSARKQLLSFDLSQRVAHMWRISGGKLGAVTKSLRKAALNHTARVALPSKLVTDHDHRGVGPAVPAYGPAGAPCMNVLLSINNQVLPFLCYANIHFSNIASRETTQHQLVGLTGALQCYGHTVKYIDAWELLAPGLVLMSLHMPPESTGAPLATSPAGLVPAVAGKQPAQPQAWLGSAPAAHAAKSSTSLAAQLLHAHSAGGAAGAARGGAPRRSAAIAAATVVAAASQLHSSGNKAAAPEDDSDYEDNGNDGVGAGPGEAKADNGTGAKRIRGEVSKALGRPPGTVQKQDEAKRSHKAVKPSTGGALVSNMRRLVGSGNRDQQITKKAHQEHVPGAGVGVYTTAAITPNNVSAAGRGLAVQVISGLDPPTLGVRDSLPRSKASAPLSSIYQPPSRPTSHPSSAAAAAGYISHFGGTRLLATGGGLRLQHADYSQPTQQPPGSSTHTPHASKQQRAPHYPHPNGQQQQQQGAPPSNASTPPPSFYPTPGVGGSSGYLAAGGSGSALPGAGCMDSALLRDGIQQHPSHPHNQPHLCTHTLHTQPSLAQQRHTSQPLGNNFLGNGGLLYSESLPDTPFLYPDLDSDMPGGEVSFGPGSDEEENPDPSLNPARQQHQPSNLSNLNHTSTQEPLNAFQHTGSRKNSLDTENPTGLGGWGRGQTGGGSISQMVPNQWGASNSGGAGGAAAAAAGAGGQHRPAHSGPHSRRGSGSRGTKQQRALEREDAAGDVHAGRGGRQLPGCESYKMRVNAAANRVITQAVQSSSLKSEAKQCFIQISRDLIQVALSLREDACKSLDIAALAHRLIGNALSDGLELRSDDRWAFISLATDLLT